MAPAIIELLEPHGAFLFYACSLCVVGVISYIFMPETYGLSLEEIQKLYIAPKDDKKKTETKNITVSE